MSQNIGKNLVASMLEGRGFEVIDLSTDVSPEKFVASVEERKPRLVCTRKRQALLCREDDLPFMHFLGLFPALIQCDQPQARLLDQRPLVEGHRSYPACQATIAFHE